MNRWLGIGLAVAALLVGLLAGYLNWGRPLGSARQELQQARVEADAERQAMGRALREAEARLKTVTGERERLEEALTKGKK